MGLFPGSQFCSLIYVSIPLPIPLCLDCSHFEEIRSSKFLVCPEKRTPVQSQRDWISPWLCPCLQLKWSSQSNAEGQRDGKFSWWSMHGPLHHLLADSPCQSSPHGRPCGLFSGLLLPPGEAEEFPLWRAPDLPSDLGLVEAIPFQSPVKAIPWTSSPDGISPGHPAGPRALWPDSVMDKPSLRLFKCDQLWSWERSHPHDLPNCCPCHDVGRKIGH